MAKKTKPPTRTERSDSMFVEVDGKRYFPHAGETVTFRGQATVGQLASALDLAATRGLDMEDPENSAHLSATLRETATLLATNIVAWTWTDDADVPYPAKPTEETIRGLSMEELGWLLRAQRGVVETPEAAEEAAKKD